MEELTRREREKQVREGEIVAAAEKIFCLKGFDDASMDEIAREAQFTKRTLYQNFSDKEDLYFAVVRQGFSQLFAAMQTASASGLSGYAKLYQSCLGYYQFSKDNPGLFRLMNAIGYVKKIASPDSARRQDLVQFNQGLFQAAAAVITEGQVDGSIRPDLDAEKTAFSLIFLITGFFSQLATSGDTFTENFSLDQDDFSRFTMEMIFSTIKNNRS
jgi:AcrR family transcriptional regulator